MLVLVAYATRHEGTKGIAEGIAKGLRERRIEVELAALDEVHDLVRYDALVIGSAVYMGHWLKGAREFIHRNAETLNGRPLWLFSSGPLGTSPDDGEGRDLVVEAAPAELSELRQLPGFRGHQVFFGALDPARLGLGERLLRTLPAARATLPEGDFRQWDEVSRWAQTIADELVGAGGLPSLPCR